jgi:hypothetical protein
MRKSLLFVCGPRGCDALEINDRVLAEAGKEYARLAEAYKAQHGEFPQAFEGKDGALPLWDAALEWAERRETMRESQS